MKYKFNSKHWYPPTPSRPSCNCMSAPFNCASRSLSIHGIFFFLLLLLGTGEKRKPPKFHLSVTPLWGRFLPKSSFMRRRLPQLTYLQGDKGRKAESRTGWVKSAKPSLKPNELDYRRGATWIESMWLGSIFLGVG